MPSKRRDTVRRVPPHGIRVAYPTAVVYERLTPGEKHGDVFMLLSPSVRVPGRIQVTSFREDWTPIGHNTFLCARDARYWAESKWIWSPVLFRHGRAMCCSLYFENQESKRLRAPFPEPVTAARQDKRLK